MGKLFRKIAISVSKEHGYTYPENEDIKVTLFIKRIRILPDDATDIF